MRRSAGIGPGPGPGLKKPRRSGAGGGGGGGSTLLADLTEAAGTAPTALWIPGTDTYSDDSETPAGDGDRVYEIRDQTGNGYHMREGDTNKGPVLRSSGSNGIGDKPALEFDDTNDEYLESIVSFNGGAVNMIEGDAQAFAFLGKFFDMSFDFSTTTNNPGFYAGASGGTEAAPACVVRDNTISRLSQTVHGMVHFVSASEAPYDTELAIVTSATRTAPGEHIIAADKANDIDEDTGSGDTDLDRVLWMGRCGQFLDGLIGAFAVWSVSLTEAQINDVTVVLRAYAGLEPVADPE